MAIVLMKFPGDKMCDWRQDGDKINHFLICKVGLMMAPPPRGHGECTDFEYMNALCLAKIAGAQ